ncbi:MAG: response regulator [Vallitaleaceae bacterium]|nr:response regulator [Vallitaleaceae bacterium]
MMEFLVVDDEQLARKSIISMLSSLGYEHIAEASNGLEALSYIMKNQPDIVLADIEMPGLDGLTLLERINSSGIKVSVIFISGHDNFKYAQKALSFKASDYLLKPISIDELSVSIEKLISHNSFLNGKQKPLFIKDGYTTKIIEKSQEYILNNLKADITLNSISEYVHLSSAYFSRIFKEETGENFSNYLTRVRIEHAMKLLCDGVYKANEVSSIIGFNDVKYFYKVFRKHTGLTPTEYRSLKKSNEQ